VEHHTSIPLLEQRRPAADKNILPALARERRHDGSPPVNSLYLHIPFCFHKCHYCDFYSLVDRRERQHAFLQRLERELDGMVELAAAGGPEGSPTLHTIFAGGGTPTLLKPDLWARLLGVLHQRFDVPPETEFTVECNPETATPELFDVLVRSGVNRLSIGAQSFDPRHLKTLERWHDPQSVPRALQLARDAGIRRHSLDLIFAIPGQTLAEWERDLDTALALGVTHLSCYALTYEPGTAMTARLERREFEPCDPELEAEMYLLTVERARAAGLERYEVSNFAAPGRECAHNLAYWQQHDWLAAGPSASGHLQGHRWKNVPRLDTWLEAEGPFSPVVDYEPPDTRRNLAERLMTGIRVRHGLSVPDIIPPAREIDAELPDRLHAVAAAARDLGNLEITGDRWRLTDNGYLYADAVARDLMSALQ